MILRRSLEAARSQMALVGVSIALGIAFVVVEVLVLDVRVRDYDEGVYWQSVRAMVRGEPLFASIFASQPPGFYYALLPFYLVGHSLVSLRLTALALGVLGLAATYLAGRLLAGAAGGLIAVTLAATSPLYVHQSALVQADGPSVAVSMIGIALALVAVRRGGRTAFAVATLAGVALAFAAGIKLLGVVAVIPIGLVLLGAPRGRVRLVVAAAAGCVAGALIMLVPVVPAPGAALDDLILGHLRAGQAAQPGLGPNVRLLFLHREEPLEALALIGALVAVLRRNRAIVMPLVWAVASVLAVLFYHPLFAHHLVMLSLALALSAAVGLSPHRVPPSQAEDRIVRGMGFAIAAAGLVVATAIAGIAVIAGDIQLARVPDLHNAEMTAAVRSTGAPGDFWISDNPFAVAAADRDLPGPLVDTSGQRTDAGLLTVRDLETTRERNHVRWLLEDSLRLFSVPEYQRWLGQHFHRVRSLAGNAVIYGAD